MSKTTETTTPRKAGAPRGNRNREQHGLRAWATTGRLPRGCGYARKQLGWMAAELTKATLDVVGELGPYHRATIQSACRHEGRAMLLQRLLRSEADLSLSDKLTILRDISAATDSRDKCIDRLGLKAESHRDPWAALTVPGRVIDAQEPARDTLDAPDDLSVMDGHDLAPDAASGDEEAQS